MLIRKLVSCTEPRPELENAAEIATITSRITAESRKWCEDEVAVLQVRICKGVSEYATVRVRHQADRRTYPIDFFADPQFDLPGDGASRSRNSLYNVEDADPDIGIMRGPAKDIDMTKATYDARVICGRCPASASQYCDYYD
jgi:hypothetical protein